MKVCCPKPPVRACLRAAPGDQRGHRAGLLCPAETRGEVGGPGACTAHRQPVSRGFLSRTVLPGASSPGRSPASCGLGGTSCAVRPKRPDRTDSQPSFGLESRQAQLRGTRHILHTHMWELSAFPDRHSAPFKLSLPVSGHPPFDSVSTELTPLGGGAFSICDPPVTQAGAGGLEPLRFSAGRHRAPRTVTPALQGEQAAPFCDLWCVCPAVPVRCLDQPQHGKLPPPSVSFSLTQCPSPHPLPQHTLLLLSGAPHLAIP